MRCVILFAHWAGNGVEMETGVRPPHEVVQHVDPAFDGVIDLCVCHPHALVTHLDKERKRCLVRHTNVQATLKYCVLFYTLVMKVLNESSMTYPEALERSHHLLSNRTPPA